MRDVLFLRVKVVQNHISIGGATGGENYNLGELRNLLKELLTVRSDSDTGLNKFKGTASMPPRSRGKFNLTE